MNSMPLLALVLVLASLLMLRPSNAQAEGIIEALENICGEMLELPDAGDGDAVTSLKEVRPSLKSVRRVSYPTGESEDGKKHNIPLITHMLQGKDGKVSCGRVLEDGVLLNFTAPLGSFAEMTPYVLTMFGENSSLSLTQQSDGIGSLLPMLKHGFLDTRKFLGTMASLWDPARGVRVAHRSLVEDSCSDTIDDPFNKYSVDPEKIMAPPNLVLRYTRFFFLTSLLLLFAPGQKKNLNYLTACIFVT